MKAARPTKFIAVPRVWEKMQEKMEEVGRQNGPLKRALVNFYKSKLLNFFNWAKYIVNFEQIVF